VNVAVELDRERGSLYVFPGAAAELECECGSLYMFPGAGPGVGCSAGSSKGPKGTGDIALRGGAVGETSDEFRLFDGP
jgi:hypothetical protein